MTDLSFEVVGARAEPHAAVPTLVLHVRVTEASGQAVHALVLRCQIRIEPNKRTYTAEEQARLYELFGETPQWGDSLRPFLWTHVTTTVGRFDDSTVIDLPLECSYDFEVAAAKYLHGLDHGEIPLLLLFSGTVFPDSPGGFVAERVSWQAEATYRLPVSLWRATMDLYFPNSGWVRLGRDTLDRLQRYRALKALPTWDQAIEALLKEAGADDL
jgi:hypothetical protein